MYFENAESGEAVTSPYSGVETRGKATLYKIISSIERRKRRWRMGGRVSEGQKMLKRGSKGRRSTKNRISGTIYRVVPPERGVTCNM